MPISAFSLICFVSAAAPMAKTDSSMAVINTSANSFFMVFPPDPLF